MLVTSRCRGVRLGPNTLHSRIKERKLPLNSRHESFEEERDLPIFPGLAAYRNFPAGNLLIFPQTVVGAGYRKVRVIR